MQFASSAAGGQGVVDFGCPLLQVCHCFSPADHIYMNHIDLTFLLSKNRWIICFLIMLCQEVFPNQQVWSVQCYVKGLHEQTKLEVLHFLVCKNHMKVLHKELFPSMLWQWWTLGCVASGSVLSCAFWSWNAHCTTLTKLRLGTIHLPGPLGLNQNCRILAPSTLKAVAVPWICF